MSATETTPGLPPARPDGWLFEAVDNMPLVLFRALVGLLLFIETLGAVLTGWVHDVFLEPPTLIPMIGFEWVPVPGGDWMLAWYLVMSALGAMIMVGWRTRLALCAFGVMWGAAYVMQTTHYNNHYYLITLLAFLLAACPTDAALSLDARRDPSLRSRTCPRWCLLLFGFQMALVYVYAGVAKLEPDWLSGAPLALFLQPKHDWPIIGPLYTLDWLQAAMVYGGAAFDLLVVPALLWRPTRKPATAILVVFHLFNSITFHVGVFPYLAIAFTLFFYPPDEVARWVERRGLRRLPDEGPASHRGLPRRLVLALLGAYCAVQLLLPLRHHLYEGEVNWTEEGHRMSWRMMLRAKNGHVSFNVRDPATGETWNVRPDDELPRRQAVQVACHPDAMWIYMRRVQERFAADGHPEVEIRAHSRVRLNGRRAQPLIDPAVDLAREPWPWFSHATWLLPFDPDRE